MAAPRKIDYERIEPAWRAGVKSPAQLAAEYTRETGVSVSHAAIIKHFKKLGVPRDLAAKVRAKADAMVMESMVTGKVATVTTKRDAEIIDQSATLVAQVHISHRTDIGRARKLCLILLTELEATTEGVAALEQLDELLQKTEKGDASAETREGVSRALQKVISLPSRASTLKALADSLKTLVTLEREAWGISTDPQGGDGGDGSIVAALNETTDPNAAAELYHRLVKG